MRGEPYSTGRLAGRGPRGKAASISAISLSDRFRSPAPAFSSAVGGGRCFGDREERLPPCQKDERHLARGGVARLGDFGEYPAALRVGSGKATVAERAIPGNGDAMHLAPRQNGVFDQSLLQVIEHPISGETALPLAGLDRERAMGYDKA